jgi:predicted Zn-dependent protease
MFGNGYGYDNGYGGGGFNLRLLIGLGIAIFAVVGYFTHTSVNPVTGEKQHVSMTPGEEIQLGLASAPQMEQQFGGDVPRDDPEAREVRYVGNRIWTMSDAAPPRCPYQFEYHLLADMRTVNAFALPGGQVFITRALYEDLSDEAELAAVLGHETGHVVKRHSAQQVEQANLGNRLVTAVGVGSRNGFRDAAIAGVVDQLTQLKFSRGDESQADSCGLRYMAQAGYDPRAMLDLMKILERQTAGGREPEFLVTHPFPQHRYQDITAELREAYPNGIPTDLTRGRPLPKD